MEKSLQPHSVFGTATAINCVGFYFMQIQYTTQTTIKGQFVEVNIFKNGKFLLMYDFNIKQLEEMLSNHLPEKRWATEENLIEIRESIEKHFLSK